MSSVKQRVIGALILVALAILFLPMLLRESKTAKIDVWSIPARPAVPQVTKEATLVAPPAVPITQQKNYQDAWSLQLATFSNTANAKSLVQKLRAQGYSAYVVKLTNNNKTVYKVFVGPEVNKAKLADQATKIGKAFNLKSTMVPYTAIPSTGVSDDVD